MGERQEDIWSRMNNAFGTSFGLASMSALLFYVTQLSESMSVGIIPSSSCPGLDLYFTTAITIMLYSFCSILISLFTLEALHSWNPWTFSLAFLAQYAMSVASYFLSFRGDGCIYLFITYILFNLAGLIWLFLILFKRILFQG
jgi:hypothetical protein